MKKLVTILFVLLSINLVGQKNPSNGSMPINPNATILASTDTLQYVLGVFLAQWMNSNGFVLNNPTLFLNGMQDVFQNKPRIISDTSVALRIAAYQRATQKDRAHRQELQLFNSLKDQPGVGMLPSGIHYVILQSGKGIHPSENDSLLINLIAKLTDGTVVDDTYQTKNPFTTTLAGLFPGLSEPLQMMTAGSKWQLFIPSRLAYGEKGTTLIPPNSALIIEIELVDVKPSKK